MGDGKSGLQLRSLLKKSGELEVSLVSIPTPEPGDDEVVVRVEGTPINPSDLGLLDRLGLLRVALALAVGAIQDVGLGDLVEPFADEMLLDDVLDVLDVREEIGEPLVHFRDDAIDDDVEPSGIDLGANRTDRFRDRVTDAGTIEDDHFASSLDDLGGRHGLLGPFGKRIYQGQAGLGARAGDTR